MSSKDDVKSQQIVSEAQRIQRDRQNTYRERALKLFPHVCGRCTREFSGKQLKELTVHHRDHNHDYNPPDGSNWELLCIYCHDNEHSRGLLADAFDHELPGRSSEPDKNFGTNPFAGLADLLKGKLEK